MPRDDTSAPQFVALNDLSSSADYKMIAKNLTAPTATTFRSGNSVEEALWTTWHAVFTKAASLSHTSKESDGLVSVLREVQKIELKDDSGKDYEVWDAKVWKDMPVFGADVREDWNRTPKGGAKDAFSVEQWTNLNAFLAKVNSYANEVPAFDFGLYAIWTLRDACEGREVGRENVEAGKAWLKYAGKEIERWSEEERRFDGNMGVGGEVFREKGWKGYNKERLQHWKSSLEKE